MECAHLDDITWSLQGKAIYKDQCTKCFIEAKDVGILVCLKCYNGSCDNHTKEHFQNHNHSVYMRIRLFEKEQPQQQQDIQKLIIHDIPQLEVETSIWCFKCNIQLKSEKLDGLEQSIRLADSEFKRAQVTAWEVTAEPCEHTLLLNQNPKPNLDLTKCHDCNLSANLWLCLECGNIGCGRKNYDGSGGNGHAINHNKQTGHSIVVKLGTITPEGEADCYCYACDVEIKDPEIQIHLGIFGIDVQKQTKTEKTMAELNLDANLNLTLSKILEEGKLLNPVFGPGLTGIDNIGNTCYMNSVVQFLFSLPEFNQQFSNHHLETCKKIPYQCVLCQICKVQVGLNSGQFSVAKVSKSNMDIEGAEKDLYQDGIHLYDFKSLVAKGNKEFLSAKQQDALEYWQILQGFLQKVEKSENLNQLTKLFEFNQETVIQCLNCEGYKLASQKNSEFKIPVEHPSNQQVEEYRQQEEAKYQERVRNLAPGEELKPFVFDNLPEYKTTFEKSLNLLEAGQHVELYCTRCNQNSHFIKKEYFSTFPKYLFVPVERFVLQNWVPKKLNANIEIQQEYDFAAFKLPPLDPNKQIQEQVNQQLDYSEDQLQQLSSMGFSINRCKRALKKYKGDVEQAMMYIMETIDDNTQDQPEVEVGKQYISNDNIELIQGMGFTAEQAQFALQKTDNNIDRAIDYIFNHDIVAEMLGQQDAQVGFDNNNSKFRLVAAIVHLGVSVHCGHYVSYIKKNGKWILFNDSKVAETNDPVFGKGYIYVFERNDLMIQGNQIIAQSFAKYQLEYVFGIVGVPVIELGYAFQSSGLKYYGFRNEQALSYGCCAIGYLTQKPAICLVVSGPGVVHALAGAANAQTNGFPMIIVAGASDNSLLSQGGFQEYDQLNIIKPYTKFAVRINDLTQAEQLIERAIRLSLVGRPGCTYIEIPGDILRMKIKEETILKANSFTIQDIPRSLADPRQLSLFSSLLKNSKQPLIIIGKGASYARAEVALRQFVNSAKIPFLPTPMGKGVVQDSSEFNISPARSTALQEADVILLVGCRLNWILHFGLPPRFRNDTQFIQIDILPEEFHNNRKTIPLQGDCNLVVQQLNEELKGWQFNNSQWMQKLNQKKQINQKINQELIDDKSLPLQYYSSLGIISSYMPKDCIYVGEGSNTMDIGRTVIQHEYPRHKLDTGTFAPMGLGIAYAIAAKLVHPEKQVFAIVGDSAFGFSGLEIETATRYNIPLVIIIINNNGIFMGVEQIEKENSSIPVTALNPDSKYELMGDAFGFKGVLVNTHEELHKIMQEIQQNPNKSYLVNVKISPFGQKKPQEHAWLTQSKM